MMKKYVLIICLIFLSSCSLYDNSLRLMNHVSRFSFSTTNPTYVTVKRKDTLYSIAKYYRVPMRQMIEINRLQPPYNLYVGQRLKLSTAKYHIVAKGDTVYNISKRYNVE